MGGITRPQVDMPDLASPRCPYVARGERPEKGRQAGHTTWDYEVARRRAVRPRQQSRVHPYDSCPVDHLHGHLPRSATLVSFPGLTPDTTGSSIRHGSPGGYYDTYHPTAGRLSPCPRHARLPQPDN